MTAILAILILSATGPTASPLAGAWPAPERGWTVDPDTLRLAECHEAARRHFPLRTQTGIHDEITALQIDHLNARFLPQLTASGRAVYQSDVPELPIEMPGFSPPEVRRDQYEMALGVEQLVFDGGVTAAQREMEAAAGRVEAERVRVSLRSYLERVDAAYFRALLQESALATLEAQKDEVAARREAARAQTDAGLLTGEPLDVLEVQLLELDQRMTEARARRRAALDALRRLTGLTIDEAQTLVEPELPRLTEHREEPAEVDRPELRVFELQKERLSHQGALAARTNRPRISGFGTAAYGRPPGMNIFENELSPYFSFGVRLRWPILDWGSSRRNVREADLRHALVETEQEAFSQSVRTAAEEAWQDVTRLRESLDDDHEIIRLRERMAVRAAGQMENGTISATEYLIHQQAVQQARLTYERHRIELSYAEVRYLSILGQYDAIR